MGLLRTQGTTLPVPPALASAEASLATLRSGEAAQRRAAALDLAGVAAVVPALLAALAHEADTGVRSAILSALVETGGAASASGLAALLRSTDVALRNAAAEALRRMPADAAAAVQPCLESPDQDLRIAALMVLLGVPHDVEQVRTLLAQEGVVNVALAGIEVLARQGASEDVALLRKLPLRFPDEPGIAFAVRLACHRIEGHA